MDLIKLEGENFWFEATEETKEENICGIKKLKLNTYEKHFINYEKS